MIPTSKIDLNLVDESLQKIRQETTAVSHQEATETTRRDTLSFGYDYFDMQGAEWPFTPIPDYMVDLCRACIHSFAGQPFELGQAEDYQNVIISMYKQGRKLEPHADVSVGDKFSDPSTGRLANFYFGENILGVVLETDETGRLYFVKSDEGVYPIKGERCFELNEHPGLTYVLRDEGRYHPYYHGVSPVSNSRISVTFRTVHFTASTAEGTAGIPVSVAGGAALFQKAAQLPPARESVVSHTGGNISRL